MRFLGLAVLLVATAAIAAPEPDSRTAIDFIAGAHALAAHGDDGGLHAGLGAAVRIHDLLPVHRLDIEMGWERTQMHGDADFDRFDRFRFTVGTGFDLGNDFDLAVGAGLEVLDATRVVPSTTNAFSLSFRDYKPVASAGVARFVDLGGAFLGGEIVARISEHDGSARGLDFSYVGADAELRVILRI
ncbi:MAG TPA: hypothetical protein VGM90_11575 [Kofleriaceae bacterium]